MGQGQSNLNVKVPVILAGDFHQCHIIILWMFLLAGEKCDYTIPDSYTLFQLKEYIIKEEGLMTDGTRMFFNFVQLTEEEQEMCLVKDAIANGFQITCATPEAATFYTEDADLWMVQGSRWNNSGYQKLSRCQKQIITPKSIKFGIVITPTIPDDGEPVRQTSYTVKRFERQRVEEPGVEYRVQWKPEENEDKDKVEVRRKAPGEEEGALMKGTLMSYTLKNTIGEDFMENLKKWFKGISEHMGP